MFMSSRSYGDRPYGIVTGVNMPARNREMRWLSPVRPPSALLLIKEMASDPLLSIPRRYRDLKLRTTWRAISCKSFWCGSPFQLPSETL